MTGTAVKTRTGSNGIEYRQQIVSDVYITAHNATKEDGSLEGEPWLCLETRNFGRIRQGTWAAE